MATSNITHDGSTANGAELKFIIMNTGGKNSGEKTTDRRKQAVFDVITKTKPTIGLLQEFSWTNIRSRGWKDFIWPENLEFFGNSDTSFIYDVNEVKIEQFSQTVLDRVLSELDRKGIVRQGFVPIPRMSILKVKTMGVPVLTFLCISWHGRHNRAKYELLKEEFKDLMTYVLKLSEQVMLPLVVVGDFNVKLEDVKKDVPSSLVPYEYIPTERREKGHTIDFYICSDSLVLNNIKALELKTRTDVHNVLSLFNHYPLEAMLIFKQNQ